jgi:hypothetical protein
MVMTGLILLPLMIFAAFGVDLASWYSRISYLQKSADAAALAGTVWMPDLAKATTEAKASLRENGIIDKDEGGLDDIDVEVGRGSRPTSLRVVVTDNSATRYFSQVFSGTQTLSRSAEAEYNLPIPLGSPLNYFGGDSTRTGQFVVTSPPDHTTVRPITVGCNIGTASSQGLGGWRGNGTWDPNRFVGSDPQCVWGATGAPQPGTSPVPPPDYRTRAPNDNQGSGGERPCNVFGVNPAPGLEGRYSDGGTYNTGNYTGSGNRQCVWNNMQTQGVPSYATTLVPSNAPCNVGYAAADGRWTAGGVFEPGQRFTQMWSTGNVLCRWAPVVATTNPIDSTRSPGFWAMIEGPGAVSPNGDAYNTRCYIGNNCSGQPQNVQYRQPTNPDRGFWYVVKMPNVALGPVDINVFDASYNSGGDVDVLAGDRSLGGSSAFDTEFRVFRQDNPLDFSVRAPYAPSTSGDQTEGSCYWHLGSEASFRGQWKRLCTITAPVPGALYLVNVQSVGTTGNGINGYALEAVANGGTGTQPAVYAYANMGMQNNNTCSPTPCTPPAATFYLAEVGPQYAGKTLVVNLWDPGDASGNASLFPKMPSQSVAKPVVDVPFGACAYTSSPSPSAQQGNSDGGPTGAIHDTQQPSDFLSRCGIRTTVSGNRQFNGEWLTIRIAIPSDYTWCTLGVNPEINAGSCWWGIEYNFSASANDVTTWKAHIEGNPVHLIQ